MVDASEVRSDPWPEVPVRRRFETAKRWRQRRAMWATATVLHWSSHLGGTSPWVPAETIELAGLVLMVMDSSDPSRALAIMDEYHAEQDEKKAAA